MLLCLILKISCPLLPNAISQSFTNAINVVHWYADLVPPYFVNKYSFNLKPLPIIY